MFSFHRRCDREIARLERILDYQTALIESQREEIALLHEKPVVPVGTSPANVFYMDDHRLMEMEAEGDVPT